MRKFEFRAWHARLKRMIGWEELQGDVWLPELLEGSASAGDVLMQATGFVDRNGIAVYEGDIVVCESYPFYGDATETPPTYNELNYAGVVSYSTDDALYYLDLIAVSDRVRGCAIGSTLSEYVDEKIKVIGNIYENPELLNG